MSFYIDLTEFLINPITTGIQRIIGEICKHTPPDTAIPVRFDSQGYQSLPRSLIDAIASFFRHADSSAAERIRTFASIENGSPVTISPQDIVLVPEVFDNAERIAFFSRMTEHQLERCRFIVYDLLPVTHPEYFIPDNLLEIYGYFRTLRRATCCGFISEDTREVYYERLKRTNVRGGVVLPLGCDSLGPRIEQPALNRPLTFTVIGTIEPRKNHKLILEAFEPLLREVSGLRLSFVGKMGWVDPEFAEKVHALASNDKSGFRFYSTLNDDAVRSSIEQSRATIYVSTAEGYGLPPVESLWLGTPVLASRTIPSLKRLGTDGIHYVEPLSADNLRHAVLSFVDDAYANQKAQETVHLQLPTWQSFAQEVSRWCLSAT